MNHNTEFHTIKPPIAFIDDDLFYVNGYLEELDMSFAVAIFRTAREAERNLQENANVYLLAVLDVMMPAPGDWPSEDRQDAAEEGTNTGLVILRRLKDIIVSANLPIIVLTNRERPQIEAEVAALGFPYGLVKVYQKAVTQPTALLHAVRESIQQVKGVITPLARPASSSRH